MSETLRADEGVDEVATRATAATRASRFSQSMAPSSLLDQAQPDELSAASARMTAATTTSIGPLIRQRLVGLQELLAGHKAA